VNVDLLDCRLLLDGAADGAWNMAVDEVLLETTASTGRAALRLYQWIEPTLSLGYFQRLSDRSAHPASGCLRVVRRLSGGGAIVHDRELTYSITIPRGHDLARDAAGLYRRVHGALIQLLTVEGVAADLHPGPSHAARAGEPFLCFERRGVGDVVVSQAKVAGSAQRRRAGAVLQHGSLLIDASPAAPELPGLRQVTHGSPLTGLQRLLPDLFASALGLSLRPDSLSPEEERRARALVESRFGNPQWTAADSRGRKLLDS
jgi:lipoate-protein ligase A